MKKNLLTISQIGQVNAVSVSLICLQTRFMMIDLCVALVSISCFSSFSSLLTTSSFLSSPPPSVASLSTFTSPTFCSINETQNFWTFFQKIISFFVYLYIFSYGNILSQKIHQKTAFFHSCFSWYFLKILLTKKW